MLLNVQKHMFSSLPLLNISPSFPVTVIIKEIDNMSLEEGQRALKGSICSFQSLLSIFQ